EVVERPASVVKELVENSLDAGAREVSVRVEGSGAVLIRVSDDGDGMAPEDLSLAVERHSTSKVKEEGDLFHIATLGFRGEALPSIGSVAKLEIISRARGEPTGYRLRIEAGKKETPVAHGCPVGTTVEVRELFFNTPARRKFLKSPQTELGHISDVINRMALAFPEVHFRLHHGSKVLCDHVATVRLDDRLRQVLGGEIAADMVPVSMSRGNVSVAGFLSSAPSSLPNTRYLMTYVNRRFVRDRILTHAVLAGYETLLMKGRYPAAVIYLKTPLGEVDVNVHPAKYEVRFRRQAEVHDALLDGVRDGLKQKAKAPPGQSFGARESRPSLAVHEAPRAYAAAPAPGEFNFMPLSQTAPLTQEPILNGFFSSLEVLGQLLGCYLVCASPNGLVLIDQHAAHERAAFEKMRARMEKSRADRQHLLLPQALELPYAESVLFERMLGLLDQIGFGVEPFGSNTYILKSIPALLPPGDYREALRRMAAEAAEIGQAGELRHDLEERLMTIACHSVIRANRKLDREEMRALLNALDQADFATQCPHGRPVVVQFSQAQLERMFKRT
ncbi:MAG: DNA mismatch repair endonuclease MutL, partial [Candidatus Binatia bacterium]